MEIKVQCECGARYKFEIEPVHGRMPTPVKCPECGVDGTVEANRQIHQALSGTPVAPAPVAGIPLTMPAPSASLPPAPPPPPPSPPAGGLRVNRPPPLPPSLPVPSGGYIPPPPPMPPSRARAGSGGKRSVWPKVLIGSVVAFCLCGGLGALLVVKYLPKLTQFATEMGKAGNKDEVLNLNYEDGVVLFIRHSNHTDVAEACKAYWRDKHHKTLTVSAPTNWVDIEIGESGEFELLAAHNNFVRIICNSSWPAERYENLALHLSQKLDTLVFEYSGTEDEKSEEDYLFDEHFGAYEQGARKFHALIHLKIAGGDKLTDMKIDRTTTTDGGDWAAANGYKPGAEGFKDFDLSDADKITRHLGMKFWDEETQEIQACVMKER